MLTIKQVADQLGVSRGLVYKLVAAGQLESHRIGSTIRIAQEQLNEYLQRTRSGDDAGPFEITAFKHLDL